MGIGFEIKHDTLSYLLVLNAHFYTECTQYLSALVVLYQREWQSTILRLGGDKIPFQLSLNLNQTKSITFEI